MVTSGSFGFSELATAKYFFAPKCLQTPQHCYFERRQGLKRLRKPNSNSGRDPGQTGERSRKRFFWGDAGEQQSLSHLRPRRRGKEPGFTPFFPFPSQCGNHCCTFFSVEITSVGGEGGKIGGKGENSGPHPPFPAPLRCGFQQ